jgi:hypothetical protein
MALLTTFAASEKEPPAEMMARIQRAIFESRAGRADRRIQLR